MSRTAVQPHAPFSGDMVMKYDQILGPVYFEPYAIETAGRVAELHAVHVLETACGTGRVTNHLRRKMSSTAVLTATDISNDMLLVAKKKLPSNDISLLQADAASLPFDDEQFGVVVCQFGAMFFADKPKAFSEAHRVLKKNGTFIFTVWDALEFNPVHDVSRNILKEFFGNDVPANLNVAFSMTDHEEMKRLLQGAGFVNPVFDIVQKPCIVPSADELSGYTVKGSTTSELIRKKDPDAIPVLREKMTAVMREKFGDKPARGTMQAIYVTAKKNT